MIELQTVDFFIPLPEPINIGDRSQLPVVEIDDGEMEECIRFVDSNGVNRRFNRRFMFHQVPYVNNHYGVEEAFEVAFGGSGEDSLPTKIDSRVTVVQVGCITGRVDLSQEEISKLFDEAISSIRRYLKAYHLVTNENINLVTRQNTAAIIPCTISNIDNKGGIDSNNPSCKKSIFLANNNIPNNDSVLQVSTNQMDEIAWASRTYLNNVLDQFYNVRREAYISYDKGNTIVSGILAGVATEILLDELLLLLLWEENSNPQDVYNILRNSNTDTTLKRVEYGLYSEMLGSKWSTSKKGSILRKWKFNILELRNRIVHSGYEPTQGEMESSFATLHEVVEFISDELCKNISTYPICVKIVVGNIGISKRGLDDKLKLVMDGCIFPGNPYSSFANWKFEIERFKRSHPYRGVNKQSILSYLVCANGEEMWLLLDDSNRLVRKISDQSAIVNGESKLALDKCVAVARNERKGQNTLIELRNIKPKCHKYKKDWFPVYIVSDQRSINRWPISYLPPT